MKIVFVLPVADTSGGIRTVAIYARSLALRGHQVTVVSPPPASPALGTRIKSLLRGRGWPRADLGPSHLDDLEGVPVEQRVLERYRPVTEGDVPDADVVVATWWQTAEWVAALSPRKGVKVHFIQGHESDLPGQPKELVDATWRLPFHRVVCSRWLEGIAAGYGVRATVVNNGVDVERFSAPPRGKQARPTVGVVYSDVHIKGCDVAVEAYRRAAARVPGLRLRAFGHQRPSPAVPLPAEAEFELRPAQERIPAIYAGCDAWLWPSRREGFGLPILEALACRTPVVAAPAGAAAELLADGGGVLLPAADPAAMAAAIEALVTLPEGEWRARSEAARGIALRHGWEGSSRQFEAALVAACAHSPVS
jgi:glycosyltransferase involved in cell wall biosynthesis